MDIDVRALTDPAQLHEFVRSSLAGFVRGPSADPALVAHRASYWDLDRVTGAFEEGEGAGGPGGGERCVGTFRSFPQPLTAVGGATVTADAITAVTVAATHRRRGLLGRMMDLDLRAAKERGEMVATLIPTQYPIYGRFGFGPATSAAKWRVDVTRSGLDPRWSGPSDGGRVDFVDLATVREAGPGLYEEFRAGQPGAVGRDALWWRERTGEVNRPEDWKEPFTVLYRSASGRAEGLLVYQVDGGWTDARQPAATARVQDLVALTTGAYRALWEFLCAIDQVAAVVSGFRAPDDLLPQLLPDPRAAAVTAQCDWLWVRVLDVVRALEARTYAAAGSLVLEVVDPQGFTGGRYRLTVEEADGPGSCAPSREEPDLVLEVAELGALWLGDESVRRLALLGRVAEGRTGAVDRADRMLRTVRRPWCPDMF
ncbi:GNAT family N-acetyltransferase [Streptomyces sp. NPDC007088]|uniref:GNAT family N-acetyltransferase n=1 Tax=Streptomyces sp. NPDC007088 TaxID=3364773 RepID=UPI0036C221CA